MQIFIQLILDQNTTLQKEQTIFLMKKSENKTKVKVINLKVEKFFHPNSSYPFPL